jgi:type III restriction enzyme
VLTLKQYQSESLHVLRNYLEAARAIGAAQAFAQIEKPGVHSARAYQPLEGRETTPYVCLRLPTGGGKTLLSAHVIKLAALAYLDRDYPVALWLVPTTTIRLQTLDTLRKPGHANYEALRDAFDGRFRVFDISEFTSITPSDLATGACIIVATIQTLRVTNTDGRKVYAHNEDLEPHFVSVPDNTPDLERTAEGQIKYSLRNLLALRTPLVVVDEAHNHSSALSYEVLDRVNAACVIEFTATPARDSNVLHNVSATELKAEEMIKLPIRLSEHKGWEDAVRDSILTRQRLANLAVEDTAYIRPIVLFQAEDKGQEVTKEVLLKHLIEQEKLERARIAVVTGDQKELDGINLLAPDCTIDFVITVEALKEGWDCSFAYVFCSLASVKSKKDVEQLLGRVLRMPYATRRDEPTFSDLNCAYAHVSRSSWPNAIVQLHDRLVDMGFEHAEAFRFIERAPTLFPVDDLFSRTPLPTVIEIPGGLETFETLPEEKAAVTVQLTETGASVTFTGPVSDATIARLVADVKSAEVRKKVDIEAKQHVAVWRTRTAPATQGVPFVVPHLCFQFEGQFDVANRDAFLDAHGWQLTDYPSDLLERDFSLTQTGIQWEIDLNLGGALVERVVGRADQYQLDFVDVGWSTHELTQWLERRVRQPDVTQPVLLEWVRRAVAYLIDKRHLPLTALVRWKFVLAQVVAQRIGQHRRQAASDRYQTSLFGTESVVATTFMYAFDFASEPYAPHWSYKGTPYQFQKHYYPGIGELRDRGEEFSCAVCLDQHPQIKHWVRNLSRRGFSLPLADGRFYPDFVAELNDGRLLVVEHKGEVYATNDDSKEKCSIGALWEAKSDGRALFLMTVVEKDKPGLYEQIEQHIAHA